MDYGNAKTPSMHHKSGSVTLLLLAFLGKATSISHWRDLNRTVQLLKKKTSKVQTNNKDAYFECAFVPASASSFCADREETTIGGAGISPKSGNYNFIFFLLRCKM